MKKMKILLLILSTILNGWCYGYNLDENRIHWKKDIQFYVQDSYRLYVLAAVSKWQEVLGKEIIFTETSDPFSANLVIVDSLYPIDGNYIALASPNYYGDEITFGSIFVYQPELAGTAVFLHEIGHILGLSHSEVISAVMYPYVIPEKIELDQDDINGICDLYGVSYVKDIPIKITWIKGRQFKIESYTGAVVVGNKVKFVIDNQIQKLNGRFPINLTIYYNGIQKQFQILKPNKRKSLNLNYEL